MASPLNPVPAAEPLRTVPATGFVQVWQVDRVLGHNLQQYRRRLRASQTELAARVGITRSALGSYEEGRAEPCVAKLRRLCEAFGITLDELLTPTVLTC